MNEKYLAETKMLDFSHIDIQELIASFKWQDCNEFEKIASTYNFVRDEIKFGYNMDDAIVASKVLKDGYGQCNTKGTLFMALLRALGIPCRLHGFTINKLLQKGAMTGFIYNQAPKTIVHSWIEVYFDHTWFNLEGFILDKVYLQKLQQKFSDCKGSFCGYGVAVKDFNNPIIDFNRNDTYIQKEGISQDFGVFDNPDEFFAIHKQSLNFFKKFVYRNIGRHIMNRNISNIRGKNE